MLPVAQLPVGDVVRSRRDGPVSISSDLTEMCTPFGNDRLRIGLRRVKDGCPLGTGALRAADVQLVTRIWSTNERA